MVDVSPLYDKNTTCTYCDEHFQTMKVRTRFLKVKEIESDFCTIYEDESISPYLYFVNVCPNCGFSFTENFSPYFTKEARENIRTKIQSRWKTQNFGKERSYEKSIITYKLALISAQAKQEPMIISAGLCMRISWLYRKLKNKERELYFLRLSLQSYLASYENGDHALKKMKSITLEYLIAEIHFRIGNFDDALNFYMRVVSQERQTTEHSLVKKARQQWRKVREILTGEPFCEDEDNF